MLNDRSVLQRTRYTSGLISIVAAATTTALFTCTGNAIYIVRKVMCRNNQGANIQLVLGYDNLAVAWVPVMPSLTCLTGLDNEWVEAELPVAGNTVQGWTIDATPLTGWAGVIAARVSAAAAIPNDVQVTIEVEEILL